MALKEETETGVLELAHTGSKILLAIDSLKLAMVGGQESIYTMAIGKCYQSEFFFSLRELVNRHTTGDEERLTPD